MNTRVSKKYYLIPLLYIGLIGVLLYLQFAREEPLHLQFGSLTITGHTIAGSGDPPALADISLQMHGLSFAFTRTTPVRVTLTNGSSQAVALKGYSPTSNGIQLSFASGLTLRFAVGKGDDLSIEPTMPHGVQVQSVSFPYEIRTGDTASSRPGIPVLAVSGRDSAGPQTYVLTLPFRSQVDPADGKLVLTATDSRFGPVTYRPAAKANEDPLVYWFARNAQLPDQARFSKAVGAYIDKAWNGWTGSRFDAKAGTWQMRDGSPAFKEAVVKAILAEALARGSYATWLPAMEKAAALHSGDITLQTTPYFGNLAQTYRAYATTEARTIQSQEQQLQQGSEGVLGIDGLLTSITDHGSRSAAQTVLSRMDAAQPGSMKMPEILNLIRDDLSAAGLGYSATDYDSRAFKLINERVLPAIIRTNSGFFLETAADESDVASSILAGRLLVKSGTEMKDQIVAGIGRQLILSAIGLSDSEGFVPGRLSFSGDRVAGTEGFLAPERIYPELAPTAYYPREVPLAKQIAQGTWAWTASQIVGVDSTQKQISITFDFPRGTIEHIVLHGIKPFSSIRLYGIHWRTDPQFERYRAGWVYNPADQTLLIKLEHRQERETVDILY